MRLISMVDFVLTRDMARSNSGNALCEIEAYAQFLKQPLTLGMFVPCDEEGNFLEFIEYESWEGYDGDHNLYIIEYEKAIERVLFKDFCKKSFNDVEYNYSGEIKWVSSDEYRIHFEFYGNVEKLFLDGYELELTENALKQIGL